MNRQIMFKKDRLIYKVDDASIYILVCRYHYNEIKRMP
ncbi:MAG: type II toxin-antitoxin system YoeB family toxin [Lachnospiraceae bacterium]|nr:type II toxin-antitoxin system YoeB family toxin [Lachnospiraceae bacterium]